MHSQAICITTWIIRYSLTATSVDCCCRVRLGSSTRYLSTDAGNCNAVHRVATGRNLLWKPAVASGSTDRQEASLPAIRRPQSGMPFARRVPSTAQLAEGVTSPGHGERHSRAWAEWIPESAENQSQPSTLSCKGSRSGPGCCDKSCCSRCERALVVRDHSWRSLSQMRDVYCANPVVLGPVSACHAPRVCIFLDIQGVHRGAVVP